jgi:glycosyltransferase involved in cell wall biosynthesis
VKVVYWAPGGDRDSATSIVDGDLRPVATGVAFTPLAGSSDNLSDAQFALIFGSPLQLTQVLDALIAARATGKRAIFRPLADEHNADPDRDLPMLRACCAAADLVLTADAEPGADGDTPVVADPAQLRAGLEQLASGMSGPTMTASGPLLFDVTTSVLSSGTPTGIGRLEADLYAAVVGQWPERVLAVAWNRTSGNFVLLPSGVLPAGLNEDALAMMEADGRARQLTREAVGPGAQLLLAGGTGFRFASYMEAVSRVRLDCGAPLTVLIHDLAQWRLKSLYPPETSEKFERHARRLAAIADRFLVYSDATRADLAEFLGEAELPFRPIAKFRMGNTLHRDEAAQAAPGRVPDALSGLTDKQFVLYVSSIEPRKNHRMLIGLWRDLIAARGDATPRLLLVGRAVMDGQALMDQVAADPAVSKHVHFAAGLHDEDLDWCYRNAMLTVYPSLYEGWGLPVAESLLYGKACLTSNVSSMREIAPPLTDLLDPNDPRAWSDRITFYLDNPDALARREEQIRSSYEPYTWQSAAGEVMHVVRSAPSGVAPASYIEPSATLRFGRRSMTPRSAEMLRSGWRQVARGQAIDRSGASLTFTYLGASARFYLRLVFGAKAGDVGAAPLVEVEGGEVTATFNRDNAALDLVITRKRPLTETRLRLRSESELVLTRAVFGDQPLNARSSRPASAPARRRPPLVRLGRRLFGRFAWGRS